MVYNGAASLVRQSSLEVEGSANPEYGKASLQASSTVAVDGTLWNPTLGSCSISSSSKLTVGFVHLGKISLSRSSLLTLDGIFVSIGARVDALIVRVDDIEEQLGAVPEGTDFLTPEDVQPLFNNREVIFDV